MALGAAVPFRRVLSVASLGIVGVALNDKEMNPSMVGENSLKNSTKVLLPILKLSNVKISATEIHNNHFSIDYRRVNVVVGLSIMIRQFQNWQRSAFSKNIDSDYFKILVG